MPEHTSLVDAMAKAHINGGVCRVEPSLPSHNHEPYAARGACVSPNGNGESLARVCVHTSPSIATPLTSKALAAQAQAAGGAVLGGSDGASVATEATVASSSAKSRKAARQKANKQTKRQQQHANGAGEQGQSSISMQDVT